jgi:hypothetical protein
MWQLPLTYLGLIAITLNAITGGQKYFSLSLIFGLLAILGGIMIVCLYGADRRYRQTIKDANELEAELKIRTYTAWAWFHTHPYYALMAFGVLCCVGASVSLL